MTLLQRHPAVRWIAPAVALGAVAGSQLVGHAANAAPALPQKTPQQLVDAVLAAKVAGFSGTVESTADLGLPALPDSLTSSASASSAAGLAGLPLTLLTGTHTMSVWHAEGVGSRVALRAKQAETGIVSNRTDAWVWNSADRSVAHADLRAAAREAKNAKGKALAKGRGKHANPQHPDARAYTPQQVAAKALQCLGRTTAISSTDNTTVAGRSAYDLVLTPKQAATKVGSVHIAVDAETSMPLRVEVYAKGAANPALEVGFTDISYAVPAASTFTFTPPAGSKVTEIGGHDEDRVTAKQHTKPAARPAVKTVGTAWETVVVARMPKQQATKGKDAKPAKDGANLLATLPAVSGRWGRGRLLDTALFAAVITDDGRVAAGAVQPASLYRALTTK